MMCLNPDAQKRAQQEVDTVVGGERLPTFEDLPDLPYVDACVKETLRYWTVAPLGTFCCKISGFCINWLTRYNYYRPTTSRNAG